MNNVLLGRFAVFGNVLTDGDTAMQFAIVKAGVVNGEEIALMRVGFPVILTSRRAQGADAPRASHNTIGRAGQYDRSYGQSSRLWAGRRTGVSPLLGMAGTSLPWAISATRRSALTAKDFAWRRGARKSSGRAVAWLRGSQ